MKRHFYYLQSHYTNTIHKLMNDLVSDPLAPHSPLSRVVTLLHSKYPHLEHWPDDPLLSPKHPTSNTQAGTETSTVDKQRRLHLDLCLHVMYSTLLSYIESAVVRGDRHVVCFAVLLMVLLWREELQFCVRQDKLEWLWRVLSTDHGTDHGTTSTCALAARFLQDRHAIVPIIWSRATDDVEPPSPSSTPTPSHLQSISSVFDNRVRFGEHRKILRKFTDDLARKTAQPPTAIAHHIPNITALLEEYAKLKLKALNKAKFSAKSRLWKSGLQLIRENFGAQLSEILESLSPGCTTLTGPDAGADALAGQDDGTSDEGREEYVVMAPSPKRSKTSSSSSSSSRSVTPFQEAEDMPNIM